MSYKDCDCCSKVVVEALKKRRPEMDWDKLLEFLMVLLPLLIDLFTDEDVEE
jgi:hypothetical protein